MVQDVGEEKDSQMETMRAVITGATGGIGGEVCKYLAEQGYTIYAACRNMDKAKILLNSIPEEKRGLIHFIEADLTSLLSTRNFCNSVVSMLNGQKIDLLINNAGMIAKDFLITPDSYETSMQVNCLSVTVITENLLPHIKGKIINTVSCTVHSGNLKRAIKSAAGGFSPLSARRRQSTISSLLHYSDSKLMLALYTIDLHKKNLSNNAVEVYGADPGIVNTGIITMHRWYDILANIVFRPFIKSAKEGAEPIINAIRHRSSESAKKEYPILFKNGSYYAFPKRIKRKYGRAAASMKF